MLATAIYHIFDDLPHINYLTYATHIQFTKMSNLISASVIFIFWLCGNALQGCGLAIDGNCFLSNQLIKRWRFFCISINLLFFLCLANELLLCWLDFLSMLFPFNNINDITYILYKSMKAFLLPSFGAFFLIKNMSLAALTYLLSSWKNPTDTLSWNLNRVAEN